jgi:LysM repeat protein
MKRFLQLSLAITLVLMAAGCILPASTPPAAVASPTLELPFQVGTQPPAIMKDILSATQTAAAKFPTGPQNAAEVTPQAPKPADGQPANPEQPTAQPQENPQQPAEQPAQPKPTQAVKVVPTATPGRPATYTIHTGEFPFCLARRFNVDAGQLLNLNGLGVQSMVSPGTVIKIPQSGAWSNGARALIAHPTKYTVRSGDTIYAIACRFGDVDPNAIIAANGLKGPSYALTAGNVIDIP